MPSLLLGYYCPGGAWTPTPLSGPWGDGGSVGHICPESSQVATSQTDGHHSNGSGTWAGSEGRPELLWKPSTTQGGQGHKLTQMLYFPGQESHQERTCPPSHYCPQGTGHIPFPCPQDMSSPWKGQSPAQSCWLCFAGEETEGSSWGFSWRVRSKLCFGAWGAAGHWKPLSDGLGYRRPWERWSRTGPLDWAEVQWHYSLLWEIT